MRCSVSPFSRASAACILMQLAQPLIWAYAPCALLIDVGFDEAGEVSQRILPAEIARFHRNGVGKTLLHDVQLGADRYWLECHRHLDFARQIGILESVRVAQALARHEFQICSAERMALARGEIPE